MGDIDQSILEDEKEPFYRSAAKILDRKKSGRIFLNKSYRSSFEISSVSQRLLGGKSDTIAFERHEAPPLIKSKPNLKQIDLAVTTKVEKFFREGNESVAVLCRTAAESEKLTVRLKESSNIRLINSVDAEISKGLVIMPVFIGHQWNRNSDLYYSSDSPPAENVYSVFISIMQLYPFVHISDSITS